MENAVVIGTTFVDIKGFAGGDYDPHGRNLGTVKMVHGGVGRNVAENFANVGMPVSFVGMLEDSAIGRDVERYLREIGVGLDHMIQVPDNGIGIWMVIMDAQGNQVGSISRMPDVSLLEKYLSVHGEEIVSGADNIILEMDLNEHIAEQIICLAEKFHKPVYVIVGNLSVVLARKDLLRKTDCFICNEIEAGKFFEEPALTEYSPDEMASFLKKAVRKSGISSMVVTMGEQGAVYYDGKTEKAGICPPYPTNVVDTSGAGDAFFSGTVMGLIRKLPLSTAVQYGARLASATIGRTETSCPVNKVFFSE